MSNTANLTPRQLAFISEFLASGNATASAIAANFSPKGASVAGNRMLRNVRVQEGIQARQQADAIRLSLQREDVLAGLKAAVDQAREQSNPMAMIAGWRELGKMLGFYAVETKRVEVSAEGQGAVQANFGMMTDAQLLTLIEQGAAATQPACQ